MLLSCFRVFPSVFTSPVVRRQLLLCHREYSVSLIFSCFLKKSLSPLKTKYFALGPCCSYSSEVEARGPDITMDLPSLPASMQDFLRYLASQSKVAEALKPYKDYEGKLRETFAQQRDSPILDDHHINTVPLFVGHEQTIKVRARDLDQETDEEKDKYLLPLSAGDRKLNGSSAMVGSIKEFRSNFNLFSESSLVDLDWKNIVAAGSSVVTSLLPVEAPHNESKRAQRREKLTS